MLSDADKALYARQILLSELGVSGQERLASAAVQITDSADARVSAVARDYLARAGVGTQRGGDSELATDAAAFGVNAAAASEVARVAGDTELEGCAAWLLGAFAAVEAIKAAAGVGAPAALDADLVLAREVV